ncbi:hypothetical protein MP228_012923 [Amoeboaphelidium protococcarum]|nr:hypothetical protein MP228_012923 [Amoeboaphelidium protococcarum]
MSQLQFPRASVTSIASLQILKEQIQPNLMDAIDENVPLLDETRQSDDVGGQSSFAQTTFNSINILVGVGILSLPFAFKLAGWYLGVSLLIGFMILTNYTARIIAKCMDYQDQDLVETIQSMESPVLYQEKAKQQPYNLRSSVASYGSHASTQFNTPAPEPLMNKIDSFTEESPAATLINSTSTQPKRLNTYSDIGEAAFGRSGQIFIMILFTMELIAAAVALIILIADSLHALFPSVDLLLLKVIAFACVCPFTWLKDLRVLSYVSLVGIFTIINLLSVILYDGVTHTETPGSIVNPAPTTAWPINAYKIPLVFGLCMSGFAGHAIFPQIYRDMKQPERFGTMLNITYIVTCILYASMATFGYLMFGQGTLDEITKNIAQVPGYNQVLNVICIWIIAINPMTKFPLTMSPVFTTFEFYTLKMLKQEESFLIGSKRYSTVTCNLCGGSGPTVRLPYDIFRILLRTVVSSLVLFIAIIFPGFERIISLLGALFSFLVSVIFPLFCYLKLYRGTLSLAERMLNITILIVSCIMAATGTAWTFIPPSVFG